MILAFLLCMLCGCSMLRRRGPFPHIEVGEVLSRLEEQAAGIEDFEGRAQIRMWGMGPNQRAWLRLFYKAPDRLKLHVDGAFGIRVLEASLFGDRLRAYFPTSDRFIEEPTGAFWRNWVGLEIENSDVGDILLGTVRVGPADSMYVSEFRRTQEGYLLVLEKGAFVRRLSVDGWDLTATEEEMWDRSGRFLGRRTMAHFKNVDGVRLPERIELTQGAHRLEITFLSRRVNRGFPDERLHLRLPEEMEDQEK
ncbi:MAG: DUF4292 domain-containing protein [Candidatus Latescibacteria bacterium]|nr:DUF4292 domain-containing protein [Candidatus Latescibacterota bacterium]MCK5329514.1 DUF4292 domain-containing protein [Candidatus Latescibacterota bacterium]MCK5527079.1 DUF4292 domain-containing protein [Candidatus Latescibacterota bacterium]